MTSTPDSATNHQAQIDLLTKELQSNPSDPATLLLQRSAHHGHLGDTASAQRDIAQASALIQDPRYRTEENVVKVEQAFREITLGSQPPISVNGGFEQMTDEQLAEEICDSQVAGAGTGARAKPLEEAVLNRLVDFFHVTGAEAETRAEAKAEAQAEAKARAVAACISESIAAMEAGAHGLLARVCARMECAWRAAMAADEQRAGGLAEIGSGMYAAAAAALANLGAQEAAQAFDFCIDAWVAATKAEAAEGRGAARAVLRLLAASRPLLIHRFATHPAAFPQLLAVLGSSAPLGGRRAGGVLVASQIAAAAADPANSALFPGFDAQAKGGSPPALALLQAEAARQLDAWVQSTAQAERARGLLALAALHEAGGGALAGALWAQPEWVGDLWDQAEFDLPPTQLALLRLADASATGAQAPAMKRAGNALVQALARNRAEGAQAAEAAQVADAAAAVLAKWSGVGLPKQPPGAGAAPQDAAEAPGAAPDADPAALADVHMARIAELTRSGEATAAGVEPVQRAAEALGFLCLRPPIKDRVARNAPLLGALFRFAQAAADAPALRFAAVMLVRNLVQPRAALTEEQRRMRQLQRLSSGDAPAEDGAQEDAGDSAESAAARCVLVCRAGGCLGLLAAAVQPAARPSEGLRDAVADTFLALAAVPALRGLLAQQGGVRCLLRHLLTADAPKARAAKALPSALLQGRDRCVAFALAKIAISVPPHLAFDDPREIARLLLALLAEESDAQALLMRFEALLALTNLASAPPGSSHDVRGYLANDLDGISLVELVLLSDHVLVRRAATELVCNLVYDEAVFERFAKGADTHVPADEFTPGIVELPSDAEGDGADSDGAGYRSQRLHLLVALADVDDAATRSAAAGALAVLTSDPRCCRYLFLVHPRAGDVILGLLAVEDGVGDEEAAAFRHRVAVIWANAVSCGDRSVVARLGADDGVVAALREMTADAELPYYAAAKSALDQLF